MGVSFNKISVGVKNTCAEMNGRDASLALGMTEVFGERKEEGAAGRRSKSYYERMQESAACRPFLHPEEPSCHPE